MLFGFLGIAAVASDRALFAKLASAVMLGDGRQAHFSRFFGGMNSSTFEFSTSPNDRTDSAADTAEYRHFGRTPSRR